MHTILIVEDELNVRLNLSEILEREGFSVIAATNGAEAMSAIKGFIPDLILSDVRMPVMDGLELLQKIQEDPVTSVIPFVFLTAKAEMQDLREAMNLGADDYLLKPFRINDVLAAINTRLKKKENHKTIIEDFKSSILRKVPHELLTPLVGILGFSELMTTDIDSYSRDELKEMAGKIQFSGERLLRRIKKILQFLELRLKADSIQIDSLEREEEYSINPEYIRLLLTEKLKDAERLDDLQINLAAAELRISSFYFELTINELIENAVKFSNKGKPIILEGYTSNKYYVISVRDFGLGMNDTNIEHISVFGLKNSELENIEGLGVGLAIVKSVAEVFNGYMRIDNRLEEGTLIQLGLPVKNKNSN